MGFPTSIANINGPILICGWEFFPSTRTPGADYLVLSTATSPLPTHISIVRDTSHVTPLSWGRIDATDQIAEFSKNLVDKRDRLIAVAIYVKLNADRTEYH